MKFKNIDFSFFSLLKIKLENFLFHFLISFHRKMNDLKIHNEHDEVHLVAPPIPGIEIDFTLY